MALIGKTFYLASQKADTESPSPAPGWPSSWGFAKNLWVPYCERKWTCWLTGLFLEPDGLSSNSHPGNDQPYDLGQSLGFGYASVSSSVKWGQCLYLFYTTAAKIRCDDVQKHMPSTMYVTHTVEALRSFPKKWYLGLISCSPKDSDCSEASELFESL